LEEQIIISICSPPVIITNTTPRSIYEIRISIILLTISIIIIGAYIIIIIIDVRCNSFITVTFRCNYTTTWEGWMTLSSRAIDK
jgi:hypothetical protein